MSRLIGNAEEKRPVTLRLMAVHAHPDDESSKGAATYAYYLDRGVEVMVVSCTSGERGSILNEGLEGRFHAERDMAGLRRYEMEAAQKVVGFQHRWLGYADSGLPPEGEALPANAFAAIPVEISAAPLVRLIREFRPQVLLTYDENGGYPHPDHIRCHEISVRALEAASDATVYPEAGEPWSVSKLYYDRIFSYQRMKAVHDELLATDPQSPLIASMTEMRSWMEESPFLATTQVPTGDFFDVRDDALRAHASQVSPDSPFFFWPNDLQRRAWPFEDYQLVRSTVETTMPEADLFAGIENDDAKL
jgi:mycothiol S-conjugate amidase